MRPMNYIALDVHCAFCEGGWVTESDTRQTSDDRRPGDDRQLHPRQTGNACTATEHRASGSTRPRESQPANAAAAGIPS
jgi:hypothetical protein